MNRQFYTLLQKRIGSVSVGPSTARGMGPAGTIEAARAFFHHMDLRRAKARSERAFQQNLNEVTEDLVAALPPGGQYWGSARKFLNIFLRGCLYNRYLCERFRLEPLEPWLELPLDSHVAKGLRAGASDQWLPRWKTVIGLSPEVSQKYQECADVIARQKGVWRVHLDLLYWRGAHLVDSQKR